MPSVSFLRHAGWFGPEDSVPLNIIGVGATGSWIGLYAAKMGFHKFRIWDGDIVEDHNLPNQIYDAEHIGAQKVDAFEKVLTRFNPSIEVIKHNDFFTHAEYGETLEGPLVLTVDTMSARMDIYDSFHLNWRIQKVFETRLGFDYGELNIIDNLNTNTLTEWRGTLKDDSEIPEGPCNLRICTTLVGMVAAYTTHNICNMLSCKRRGEDFTYEKKTMFNLAPTLKTYTL